MDSELIGYLFNGSTVVGRCCIATSTLHWVTRVPMFHGNVYPYRQTCHTCGATLVEGQTPAWPELFSK